MKSLSYFLCATCFFCGCADATPKEKISELTCPYILPAETDFPASWVTVKKVNPGKLKLEQIDIAFGGVAELKDSLSSNERKFNTEITDEWTYLKDRAEFKAEYAADHDEITMLCTYGRTRTESSDLTKNVELLIPLPQKKPVDCLLVRRDIEPKYEMSCEIK